MCNDCLDRERDIDALKFKVKQLEWTIESVKTNYEALETLVYRCLKLEKKKGE